MRPEIVYLPLARTTFSMPAAERKFNESCRLLESLFGDVCRPPSLLTSTEALSDYLATVNTPALVIYQCSTFTGSDFVATLTKRFDCPVIVWSLREPEINGGRLQLNSLTGAFSAGNLLYMQEHPYLFVFGNPDEPAVSKVFKQIFSALTLTLKLRELVIGVIGTQPPGFEFGAIDETMLYAKLGSKLVHVETGELIQKAISYSEDEFAVSLDEIKTNTKGWEAVPAVNLEKHARLRTAYQDFVDTNGVKAIASRCWPDFFTEYGVPVCAVLSFLNDSGVAASCETDIAGAVSMFIGSTLTDKAVYFGDPVAIDESCDGIVFWHCGAGATSLAQTKTGATIGVHPNRKIGPVMEFGLRSGTVTVLRLGKSRGGLRLMVMKGEALDEPQKFSGTSVTVRPQQGHSQEKVAELVRDGWEPHFVVAYGDIAEELRLMCGFLNIEHIKY